MSVWVVYQGEDTARPKEFRLAAVLAEPTLVPPVLDQLRDLGAAAAAVEQHLLLQTVGETLGTSRGLGQPRFYEWRRAGGGK